MSHLILNSIHSYDYDDHSFEADGLRLSEVKELSHGLTAIYWIWCLPYVKPLGSMGSDHGYLHRVLHEEGDLTKGNYLGPWPFCCSGLTNC